jgi:pyrroline-5-carboxylate reductase
VETAVQRILMGHALIASYGGIPLIYMGDELAQLNDHGYLAVPDHAHDSRWSHRPRMDWEAALGRETADTPAARVFRGTRHILARRRAVPALHGGCPVEVLHPGVAGVFAFCRVAPTGPVVCLFNFADGWQGVSEGWARAQGARVNPPLAALAEARTLVMAVKPAKWREALAPLAGALNAESLIVSVMAGVAAAEISALTGRPTARVMPTTAVAQGRGVAGLWCEHDLARERARALFSAMAEVVDLDQEADIDVATATAGSAPAFIHAFVQALARAGEAEGLSGDAAIRLARGALRSAGAGIETGESLDTLIGRIASPGGTTRKTSPTSMRLGLSIWFQRARSRQFCPWSRAMRTSVSPR